MQCKKKKRRRSSQGNKVLPTMQAQVDGLQAIHSFAFLKHLRPVRPAFVFGQVGQLQGPVFKEFNIANITAVPVFAFALPEDPCAVSPLDDLVGRQFVIQLQGDVAADGSVIVAVGCWRVRWRHVRWRHVRRRHMRDDANC